MTLSQRQLECIVKLLGGQVLTLLEVGLHQLFVHLHHLIDDPGLGFADTREVGALTGGVEETVHHLGAALGRQIDG